MPTPSQVITSIPAYVNGEVRQVQCTPGMARYNAKIAGSMVQINGYLVVSTTKSFPIFRPANKAAAAKLKMYKPKNKLRNPSVKTFVKNARTPTQMTPDQRQRMNRLSV